MWVLTTRRRLQKALDALRHEMRVSNAAAYSVGESVAELRAAVDALEREGVQTDGAGPFAAEVPRLAGELSSSEAHLLDRLRESRFH